MSKLFIDFDPNNALKYTATCNMVAVDVLRATSSMVVALAKGASGILVCSEVEEAFSAKTNENQILVGERKAVIIDGFDFTNSPYDLSLADLNGKEVILTTSTGTRLINNCSGAKHTLVASTLNVDAVAKKMITIGGDWCIIGAGSHGEFRDEDKVGCALVASALLKLGIYKCSDETLSFIEQFSTNTTNFIKNSISSKKLYGLGRACDIDFVINSRNIYDVVPFIIRTEEGGVWCGT